MQKKQCISTDGLMKTDATQQTASQLPAMELLWKEIMLTNLNLAMLYLWPPQTLPIPFDFFCLFFCCYLIVFDINPH